MFESRELLNKVENLGHMQFTHDAFIDSMTSALKRADAQFENMKARLTALEKYLGVDFEEGKPTKDRYVRRKK